MLAICAKWDVEAVVVGEVTDTGRLRIDWHGEQVVDVPPRSVAHDGPTYHRPFERPDWQDALQDDGAEGLPRPVNGEELRATVLRLVASENLCDKSWITDQYDRYVRGDTVLAQPSDSGMIRVDEETGLGVSVATDCNGRFAKLDPYAGAQLALAEAYRNVATGGATPIAVSDCLNFGSPEDPAVMWQFAEACRGLKDGCLELGIPVTGGNVSLYNQTGDTAILPTPVVAVLGVMEDVRRRTPSAFGAEGEPVYLLGETRDELSGSEWAHVVHGHLGGRPPAVDLQAERALASLLHDAVGLLTSAHDLSDGGLAQSLTEAALRNGVGVSVGAEPDAFIELCSESAARCVVTVRPDGAGALEAMAGALGVPLRRLGTTGGDAFTVEGAFSIPLDELRAAWALDPPRRARIVPCSRPVEAPFRPVKRTGSTPNAVHNEPCGRRPGGQPLPDGQGERPEGAVLPVGRAGRAGREHRRQPGRAVVRRGERSRGRSDDPGPAARAAGRPARRRRAHHRRERAPHPAGQPPRRAGATGGRAPGGGRTAAPQASPHQADPRLEGAAAHREEAPGSDQAGPRGPLGLMALVRHLSDPAGCVRGTSETANGAGPDGGASTCSGT